MKKRVVGIFLRWCCVWRWCPFLLLQSKRQPLELLISFYNLQKRWTMANMMTKQMRLYLLKRIWI